MPCKIKFYRSPELEEGRNSEVDESVESGESEKPMKSRESGESGCEVLAAVGKRFVHNEIGIFLSQPNIYPADIILTLLSIILCSADHIAIQNFSNSLQGSAKRRALGCVNGKAR